MAIKQPKSCGVCCGNIQESFPDTLERGLRELMNCYMWTVVDEEVVVRKFNGPNGPVEIYVGIRQMEAAKRGEGTR